MQAHVHSSIHATHAHIHIYMHTHTHIHIHAHTHTHRLPDTERWQQWGPEEFKQWKEARAAQKKTFLPGAKQEEKEKEKEKEEASKHQNPMLQTLEASLKG